MEAQHIDEAACRTFRLAAELAGKKWNAAILLAMARGADRFSSIAVAIDGISDRLLTARLRELELHDLISREVVPTVPVQVLYRLTPAGSDLIRILHPLVQWSQRWDQTPAEATAPA
ncbi:MarR family transcriptional regulator [Microbacterium sp. CH12i]|uniref:winged helix-turn-helix transcriptional regulator n=1 Tax=Microbacterium sp. CH12i TaxID=1479651 RepID=UPI000460B00F|nr:helix-turn-helix domain-containing protein [Microbacterium sp. CH12i]KDA06008.1 MarR family transcriptional regulator [Microbacterium sp. CH12i]